MALPPPAYVQARFEAPFHVQVQVTDHGELAGPLGHVRTHARVLTVFTGDGLAQGEDITFDLPVCRSGATIPPGALRWMSLETYLELRRIEIYLGGTPPKMSSLSAGPFWAPIQAATREPTWPRPTSEEVKEAWKSFRRPRTEPALDDAPPESALDDAPPESALDDARPFWASPDLVQSAGSIGIGLAISLLVLLVALTCHG